jgi:hypothetical protein
MSSIVTPELLKQLSTASEALNNVSDIFNDQIMVIEEALASYNVGVTAWVHAYTDSYEEYDQRGDVRGVIETLYSVGYQKWGGKWCLIVASECDYGRSPGDADRTEWVLRDAPRAIRMRVIAAIPALLAKLVEEATKLAAEISKKTAEARVLAASIKPKKGQ